MVRQPVITTMGQGQNRKRLRPTPTGVGSSTWGQAVEQAMQFAKSNPIANEQFGHGHKAPYNRWQLPTLVQRLPPVLLQKGVVFGSQGEGG
jgi:hypothetical protein